MLARSRDLYGPNHISVAHEMVQRDEALEDDDPVGVLGSFQQQVGQRRYRDIGLLCAVKKVWKNIHLSFQFGK